jgi:hypothetical protein
MKPRAAVCFGQNRDQVARGEQLLIPVGFNCRLFFDEAARACDLKRPQE